jgi:hypothetical protein
MAERTYTVTQEGDSARSPLLGTVQWSLVNGADQTRLEFAALARRAGRLIAQDDDARDLLVIWLEALWLERQALWLERQGEGITSKPDGTLLSLHQSGEIEHLCGASANFCKALESRALEEERWSVYNPPREISHLLPSAKAAVTHLVYKEVAEGVIQARDNFAREQEVNETPAPDEAEQDTPRTQPTVEATEVELQKSGDPIANERTTLLDSYKREGKERGVRITDAMVARAASTRWNERTPVQRWKRNDPRCTSGDDAKIRSVLKRKPHLQ